MTYEVKVYGQKNSLRVIVPEQLLKAITVNYDPPNYFRLYGIETLSNREYKLVLEKYGYSFALAHYLGDRSKASWQGCFALVKYGIYQGFSLHAKNSPYAYKFGIGKGSRLQVDIIRVQESIADCEDRVIAYKVVY